ncbi:hypothetical protein AHF37_12811 [Paragonimus kellicotti]|nr:hypothetical protein AHF37_12811 [Paragonimus kellicotti]
MSRYRQSGANVRADDFILSVTDGKQSSPALRVPLHIKPRILQESKWTQLVNNSVLVQENATVPLHPSVFPDSQPDADESAHVDTGAPQYFLIVFPTKGQLVLKQKHRKQEQTQVSQFTFDDVLHGRLSYRHGPGEIGPNAMFDFARIWDFNAGKTFSLNFTLLPINSQPPVVRSEVPLQASLESKTLINECPIFSAKNHPEIVNPLKKMFQEVIPK